LPITHGKVLAVWHVTADGATFDWAKDAGATSYRVVIGNASTPMAGAAYDSGGKLTGTSVTVSTLAPGTAYEAKISAENSAGASEWSSLVLFYTTAAEGVVSTRTYTLTPESSVTTGGHFTANAKMIGTVPLAAGTYLLNVNFVATPNAATSGAVFPQAFVYNGPVNTSFTNDLFNVGSGALEQATQAEVTACDTINSYYSGTAEITVPSGGETLDVYAFGYDADTGAGSYELNSATLTATALDVAG
jgi:hypothetical protein